jgi:PAS domain S-box-containing protein
VDPRQYNRLLIRLLALPVAALAVLALILGLGLQDYQRSARMVDHSDLVIAHANHLFKLMVDEETGLRGYLLTKDPVFLQPFHRADQQLDPEFALLADLVRLRPDQASRLRSVAATQRDWELNAYEEIKNPTPASETEARMLGRKQDMDSLRAQIEDFIHAEEAVRANRSATFNRLGRTGLFALIGLAALVAALFVWETRKNFQQLAVLYNRQIAEVKSSAAESYAREQWLNTTIRSIGDAVIACDTSGNISFMNLIAEQLTGWSEAEAKGVSLHDVFRIFNEDTREAVENPVDKVRRLGTVVGLANHTFLVAKNGNEVCIDDSGAPIRDSDGQMIGIVLVFRNITERRVSESALMRAEKLATAGRMAASVAHEVNNPLEGLTNLIYIARHSGDMSEIRHLLVQAESELGRIAHITRQSLGFYRETNSPAHFKPAAIVREVTDFYLSRALSQGVTFVVKTNTETEVLGISGELRQILSNLLANSLDACPRGATIRVEANPASDPRNPSRNGVRISVADTGCGIRSDHIDSIFEPFFTTKKDTGTGLGLWVSRELVEKHGGSLRVRSSTLDGRSGTVFSIFLPAQGRRAPVDPASMVEADAMAQSKVTLPNGFSVQ